MNPCSTLYGEHIQTGVHDLYSANDIYAINFSSTSNCK